MSLHVARKARHVLGPRYCSALLFPRQPDSGRSRRGSNVGTVFHCRPFAAPGQRYYPIWFDDENTGYVF